MTDPKVIATAEELSSASFFFKDKGMTIEEWKQWFLKRGERVLKEAVQKGLFEVEIPLPFQPYTNANKKELTILMKFVRECVPGCALQFIEEEYEGEEPREDLYKLEISWREVENQQNNST